MKKLLAGILGSVALAGAAVPAGAAVITTSTQTVNFAQQMTEFNNVSKTFSLFDSNLGTLLSVNIADQYQENSTISVTNNSATSSSGRVSTSSDFTLGASNTGQNNVISNLLPTTTAFGQQRTYTLTSGQTISGLASNSAVVMSGFQTADSSNTLASDLASFAVSGGGSGTVFANTYTLTNLANNGGNTTASQSTYGTGQFKVYYTYDDSTATPAAVPEPATWLMMIAGFGLVGVGLRRRGTALAFG